MAQKILNGVHISGTTQLDFMPDHESEGIITLGRYDSNTSRYHNIKSYVSSTEASNYLKFSLHNGTANTVVDVLTLNGNKNATFAGNVVIGTVDSVVTGLSIGEASPTIQLFDTTNDAKLLMYTQDNSSIIGTYSNHPLAFYTDSGLTLTLNTDHSATFAGAGTFNTTLNVNAPDEGGAPAMTAVTNMHGYEGRGVGIKMRDSVNSASGASNREWFIGTGYAQSGFNIGYASDGSQSSYAAQSKLSISTSGNATFAGAVEVNGNLVVDGAGVSTDFQLRRSVNAAALLTINAPGGSPNGSVFSINGNSVMTLDANQDATFSGNTQAPKFIAAQGTTYANGYQLTRTGHDTYRICLGNSEGLRIVNETDSNREELAFDGAGNATFAGEIEVIKSTNQIKLSTGTSGDGYLNIGHFANGSFIGTYGDDGGAADLLRFGVHSGDVALTINSDKSATFAGTVAATRFQGTTYPYNTTVGHTANATTTYIVAGSTSQTSIELSGGDTNSNIIFKTPDSSNVQRTALTLDTSQNATFAGDINNSGVVTSNRSGSSSPNSGNTNFYAIDTRSYNSGEVGGSIVLSGKYNNAGAILSGAPFVKGYKVNNTDGDYGFGIKLGVRENGSASVNTALTIDSTSNATFAGSINLSDAQPIKWGTENILSHNGTQTYLGDATSASVLTLSGGTATFAGDARFNQRVRIGDVTGLSNRGAVRIDTRGDAPADLLFGRDTAGTATAWNSVYWSLSSRGSTEGNKFTIYRGSGHASPYNSEAIPFQIEPNLNATFAGRVKGVNYTSTENAAVGGFQTSRDYLLAGTGDRGGGLVINDVSGARHALYAGGHDLTFAKETDNGSGTISHDIWMRANAANSAGNVTSLEFFKDATFAGNVTASSGTGHFSVVNASGYQLNGTYIVDSSKNLVNIEKLRFGSSDAVIDTASTTSATATTIVASVTHGSYSAAFFDYLIKNGTNVRAGTVYACHNGDSTPLVEFAETSTVDLGDTSDVTLSVVINGTNMSLQAVTTSSTWTIKSLVRTI